MLSRFLPLQVIFAFYLLALSCQGVIAEHLYPDFVGHDEDRDDPLTHIYKTYNGTEGFDHWVQYGRHYHSHLHYLTKIGVKIRMLEIGVQSGGSTNIWTTYFGTSLEYYVGVDINPNCKQFERPEKKIKIEIGSQADTAFLKEICSKYGPFHLIIDDGSHNADHVMVTFKTLFPTCLVDYSVYVIEDTHCWGPGPGTRWWDKNYEGKTAFQHFADYQLIQSGYVFGEGEGKAVTHPIVKHIYSMHFYDSMIFINFKMDWQPMTRIRVGNFIG